MSTALLSVRDFDISAFQRSFANQGKAHGLDPSTPCLSLILLSDGPYTFFSAPCEGKHCGTGERIKLALQVSEICASTSPIYGCRHTDVPGKTMFLNYFIALPIPQDYRKEFHVDVDRIYISIGLWDIRNDQLWMAGDGPEVSEEKRDGLARSFSARMKALVAYIEGLTQTPIWLRTTLHFQSNGVAIHAVNNEIRRMGLPYFDFDYDLRSTSGFNTSCNLLGDRIHPFHFWSIRGGLQCMLGPGHNIDLEMEHIVSSLTKRGYTNMTHRCNTGPKNWED